MADIAAVFHWPPSALREMTIAELLAWHARAIERLATITAATAALFARI